MARRKKASFSTPRKRRRRSGISLTVKVLTGGIILAAAVVTLGLLGYAQLLSYLQGKGFRDSLERTLANRGQAEFVELAGTLDIDANVVTLPGASVRRAGILHGIDAQRIRSELKRPALLDRELHITRLSAEEALLSLDASRLGEKLPPVLDSSAGFLSRFMPTRLRVDQMDCKDFSARLNVGEQQLSLISSSLSASPQQEQGKGAWEFRLNNGRLHTKLPLLGDCSLQNATITMNRKALALSQGRVMLSPGELIVNALYDKKEGQWSAELRANKADMGRLLNEDWKKRLSGQLYGRMTADGGDEGLERAEGWLSLHQCVLEALPILSELPLNGGYPYRKLQVEHATARLSYPHADAARNISRAWLLDQIDLRASGNLLIVKGHAMVDDDGALAGTLLIGLPEGIAGSLAPFGASLSDSLFNAGGEEGFLWLRLNLSGTLDDPQEDLSVRLMTLLADSVPEAAGKALGSAGELFGKLFSPPEKEADEQESAPPAEEDSASPERAIKNTGDSAQDVIGSGLRALF